MRRAADVDRSFRSQSIALDVNGDRLALDIEPRRTLLDALRHDLGLRGTKKVCDMGNCGACTVLLDGKAVYSCLVLAVECEGQRIALEQSIDEPRPDGARCAGDRAPRGRPERSCGERARRQRARRAPIIGVAPAIANAVFDAIGVRCRDLPIDRRWLLEALADAAS